MAPELSQNPNYFVNLCVEGCLDAMEADGIGYEIPIIKLYRIVRQKMVLDSKWMTALCSIFAPRIPALNARMDTTSNQSQQGGRAARAQPGNGQDLPVGVLTGIRRPYLGGGRHPVCELRRGFEPRLNERWLFRGEVKNCFIAAATEDDGIKANRVF